MHIFRKPSAVSWTFPDWSLVNSVVMKPPMRKPRGQSSLCTLPRPSASGLSGNHFLRIPQERVNALVGAVGSRTWASSLCRFSPFLQWVDSSGASGSPTLGKGSRTFPGGSQGDCPPAQRPCSVPQLKGSCFQHHPGSSLQTGKPHPPSGSGFRGAFLLPFLLTWPKSRSLCPFHHQTQADRSKPWMGHSPGSSLG